MGLSTLRGRAQLTMCGGVPATGTQATGSWKVMPTFLALWLIAMLQAVPSNGVPDTGVPLTLAQCPGGPDIRISGMILHFTIPAAATEPLAGRSTIRFQLKEASAPLPLDFSEPAQRITSLLVNGRTVEPHVVEDT